LLVFFDFKKQNGGSVMKSNNWKHSEILAGKKQKRFDTDDDL